MPWTRNFALAELRGLLLEDADELLADAPALLLGIGDAGEPGEEALLGVDVHERHVEVAAEGLDDLRRLVLAQQSVVDEDARELVADRLVDEQRGDGRVDAAGERRRARARCRPARGCARPAPRSRPRPSRRAAPARRRRGSSSAPPARAACARPRGGTGRRRGRAPASSKAATGVSRRLGRDRRALGRRDDRVAVAHPDRLLARAARRRAAPSSAWSSVLPNSRDAGALDAAAEVERHELHAVADAEHRHAELVERRSRSVGAPSA